MSSKVPLANNNASDKVIKDLNWKLKVVSSTRDTANLYEPRVEMDFETQGGHKTCLEFGEQGLRKLYECLEAAQARIDQVQAETSKKK